MTKKYNVLDLFSGCAGLSCGLDQVDSITTQVALDFEPKAIETFKRNFPHAHCICGNSCDEAILKEMYNAECFEDYLKWVRNHADDDSWWVAERLGIELDVVRTEGLEDLPFEFIEC